MVERWARVHAVSFLAPLADKEQDGAIDGPLLLVCAFRGGKPAKLADEIFAVV